MTGDPVTPFLVDAYRQGLLKGHEEEAYRVLKQHVDHAAPASSPSADRQADQEYLAGGFVPYDPTRPQTKPGDDDYQHGPSATLEYALADAALGGMALSLGHTADARALLTRGQNYRSILDPDTGFFRARDADGVFVGPTDPAASVGFHEGTSWQYMWLVPQDVPGLVGRIGGAATANSRLDSFFAYDQLLKDPAGTARDVWVNGPYSYYNQDKYNPQNEPDLSAPVHLPVHRAAVEDHRRGARRADAVHRRARRRHRQRRPRHHVVVAGAVGHRHLPDVPGHRPVGRVHAAVRPGRREPGQALLPEGAADHHRARQQRHRPVHPVGVAGRQAAARHVPDHR